MRRDVPRGLDLPRGAVPVSALTCWLLVVGAMFSACASSVTTGGDGGAAPVPCSPEGAVAACYPGSPSTQDVGTCRSGSHTCSDGWWDPCTGYVIPADEDCYDGLDNDCNGIPDDGCPCNEGETKACYGGPAATRGIGQCQDGVQSCVGGTWDASCQGEVLPQTETCGDGLDNDCNGVADDCTCGDGQCNNGESCASCAADCCWCGDGQCNNGESCSSCPQDCPPGGTQDCYANGLHSNCCNGSNTNTEECLACNNEVGCPGDEYQAYCDRFNPGDNLWQQYHRGWVESHCGGPAQLAGGFWTCTNSSTCTTYTCAE